MSSAAKQLRESPYPEAWSNIRLGFLSLLLLIVMLSVLDFCLFFSNDLQCKTGNCLYFNTTVTPDKGCQPYSIVESLAKGNYTCSACLNYLPINGSLCFVPFDYDEMDPCPILQKCDAPNSQTTLYIVNIVFGLAIILNILWLFFVCIKERIQRREYDQL